MFIYRILIESISVRHPLF